MIVTIFVQAIVNSLTNVCQNVPRFFKCFSKSLNIKMLFCIHAKPVHAVDLEI